MLEVPEQNTLMAPELVLDLNLNTSPYHTPLHLLSTSNKSPAIDIGVVMGNGRLGRLITP